MKHAQDADATVSARLPDLLDAVSYPHEASRPQLIETHISWVLLAGAYAYKIKKPVDLGFLNFSTRARRDAACRDELRLNRRQAPQLYLGISSIVADGPGRLRIVPGERPEALELAVRMKRFPQSAQLDRQLAAGKLTASDMEEIAQRTAAFHRTAMVVRANLAPTDAIARAALANFARLNAAADADSVAGLVGWTLGEARRLQPVFEKRLREGFVRECHGDLHLSNLVRTDAGLYAFDCIEFDPALRYIDMQSEIAFLAMDLIHRGESALAWHFVNAWLADSGDYGGLEVLPFYLVYRSLVRAKVAAIRGTQLSGAAERESSAQRMHTHIALAADIARRKNRGAILITCGLSGSGKSHLASALADVLPAIWIRSDVERIRASSGTTREARYSGKAIAAVYDRLLALAGQIVAAGYTVLVDATFLERARRARFRALADKLGVRFFILRCESEPDVLRERVLRRVQSGADASDANLAVVERQQSVAEWPTGEELRRTLVLDTGQSVDVQQLARRIENTPAR